MSSTGAPTTVRPPHRHYTSSLPELFLGCSGCIVVSAQRHFLLIRRRRVN